MAWNTLFSKNSNAAALEFGELPMCPNDKKSDGAIGIRKLTDAEIALYLFQRFDDPFDVARNLIGWISESSLNKMTKESARELLVANMTEH